MKKVLSLVLTLSLVLGTFSMAFAASFSDVAGEDYEDAVSVLTELGVVSGYDDGTYKPENIVTRAEMAVFVVRALGYDNVTTGTSTFTDMDGYSWAQPYISMAQGLGVISGYGDGTFRPGNTVSYDEAATMLVAALGYTAEALNGTWPANFVDRARVLGIMDGVSTGGAGANRGDIATMVYQTLDQQIGKVNKDGDFVTTLDQSKKSDTMLDRLGAEVRYPNADGTPQAFVVSEADVDDAAININKYLGAYVTAYQNDDDEIIAITEEKSTFLTGEYNKNDDKFTANGVEYSIDKYGYSTSSAAMYIENGHENGTIAKAGLTDDANYTIAADVSGKTIKEIYSIATWTVTEHAVVDADDIADIEEDQSLLGVDFPLDDNDEIDLNAFDLVGVASLDDIKADNTVYVYENETDDEIARVAVGTEIVTGEITRVNSDGDTATINGTAYTLSDVAVDELGHSFKGTAGDTYTLYLDAYGEVYDLEKGAGEPDNYAIVLGVDDSTSFGSTTYEIKMFLADGTVGTFDVDDDDVTLAKGGWDPSVTAGALVSYGVNNSGEIDELAVEGDKTVEKKAISSKGYFDGKQIETDAVIFSYDGGDKTKEDSYEVTKYDNVLDSDSIDSVTYALDENKIVAMVLDGFTIGEDVFGVFVGYEEATGDYNYEVTLLVDGEEVTYSSDDNYSDTINNKTAGVYKLKFDGSGALRTELDIAENQVSSGQVAETTYAALSIDTDKITRSGNTLTQDGTVYTLESGYTVYEWDADDGYVKGNIRDIVNITDAAIKVMLFDVYDDDQAYDIVMWYK